MNDSLSFIINFFASVADWVYGNPVCSVGLIAVSFHLAGYIIIQVKKLL